MKYCKDCRYCEINVWKEKYKKLKWHEKIVEFFTSDLHLSMTLSTRYPKCFNPNVYEDNNKSRNMKMVFGNNEESKNKLYCHIARQYNDFANYKTCGSEAKYFESIERNEND